MRYFAANLGCFFQDNLYTFFCLGKEQNRSVNIEGQLANSEGKSTIIY